MVFNGLNEFKRPNHLIHHLGPKQNGWPLFIIKHCLDELNGYLDKQCLIVVIIFKLVVGLGTMYKS
jgi:hypothetical protein